MQFFVEAPNNNKKVDVKYEFDDNEGKQESNCYCRNCRRGSWRGKKSDRNHDEDCYNESDDNPNECKDSTDQHKNLVVEKHPDQKTYTLSESNEADRNGIWICDPVMNKPYERQHDLQDGNDETTHP